MKNYDGFNPERDQQLRHYDALRLIPNATPKEIKDAYRKISKETHENGVCVDRPRFEAAQEAYDALISPDGANNEQGPTANVIEIKTFNGKKFLFTTDRGPYSKPYDEIYSLGGGRFSAYRQKSAYLLDNLGNEIAGPFIRIVRKENRAFGVKRQMVWNDSGHARFHYEETEENLD